LPRATEAVPLAGATVAVLSGSSAVTGVRQGVILAVLAAALLGGFFLPWHKLPRLAQALPPWAAIGVLFVAHLVGGATSVAVFPRTVELMMRRISTEDPAAARTALCTGALQIGDATAAILFELEADGALVPSAAAPGAPPGVRLSLDGRIMTKRGEPLDNAR